MYILFDPEGELPEQLHKFSGGSIESWKKTPHGAASVDSRPRGDVPSFVSSAQYSDLREHGFKLSGSHQDFMDNQAGTSMCLLKENLVIDDPGGPGPRPPVDPSECPLPPRTAHLGPEVLEKAEKLRRQYQELKKHGMRVGTLAGFLEAHGVKVGKSNR